MFLYYPSLKNKKNLKFKKEESRCKSVTLIFNKMINKRTVIENKIFHTPTLYLNQVIKRNLRKTPTNFPPLCQTISAFTPSRILNLNEGKLSKIED